MKVASIAAKGANWRTGHRDDGNMIELNEEKEPVALWKSVPGPDRGYELSVGAATACFRR